MSSKRYSIQDLYNRRKKCKLPHPKEKGQNADDIQSALEYLREIFPAEAFLKSLPAIVMRHQLYSFIPNRTLVDKYLNELREANKLRLFRMGEGDEEFAVISLEDYCQHISCYCKDVKTVKNFIEQGVKVRPDISYSREVLSHIGLGDSHISELMQNGILTRCNEPGSWWLAVPGAGRFVKALDAGRKASLSMIRRTQYSEMLESEFLSRQLPRKAILGTKYHLHDLIGTSVVACVETSTGRLLRLRQD